jgi:hypothetical protein
MAMACSVCIHASRDQINDLLVRGTSVRDVAGRFGLSKTAVGRHAKDHLPAELAAAARLSQEDAASDTLDTLEDLFTRVEAILDEPKAKAEVKLKAIREATRLASLRAKVRGEIESAATVSVSVTESPEVRSLLLTILATLTPYPDARAALLRQIEKEGGLLQ